jgi:hypothetical protein
MTTDEQKRRYAYDCAEQGRVDCDFKHATDDPDDMRLKVRDHYDHVHRPEDYDPEAIEALIVMQAVEP